MEFYLTLCSICLSNVLSWYFRFLVDCKPRFTRTPSSTNKIYVDEGDYSFALMWDYYSDGQTVTWVDLMYKDSVGDDVVIARKYANQQLQILPTSGYNGRLTFTGRATFTLWHIEKSDRRTFECKVYFSSIVNPWIKSIVELIVVGKSFSNCWINNICRYALCSDTHARSSVVKSFV